MNELDRPIIPHKAALIENAFKRFKISSFADLGACWGVNGGYTFYALSNFPVKRAYLVDFHITNITRNRAAQYKKLEILEGELGNSEVIKTIGNVDAVIMYDILLHQVEPDWDSILLQYGKNIKYFVIYNQMFVGSLKTTRLIDLGIEEYLRNTPYDGREEAVINWFGKHNEIHPMYKKLCRDIHAYWQWGITDSDLISKMWEYGFLLHYMFNYGPFGNLPYFENHGYLFAKMNSRPYSSKPGSASEMGGNKISSPSG